MQKLTLEQAADYLEASTLEHTHDAGHAFIHTGTTATGHRFVMVTDRHERTVVTESM